jgi:transposase
MATLDDISQDKKRIAERLSRLEADRAKLAEQLEELETAERVLSRFGVSQSADQRRRGRPVQATTVASARGRQPPAAAKAAPSTLSLSEATLKAVGAHGAGATAAEVMTYLSRELGMSVRPNHLGIALQRHRRAGRLETRDSRWFLPQSAPSSSPTAMAG